MAPPRSQSRGRRGSSWRPLGTGGIAVSASDAARLTSAAATRPSERKTSSGGSSSRKVSERPSHALPRTSTCADCGVAISTRTSGAAAPSRTSQLFGRSASVQAASRARASSGDGAGETAITTVAAIARIVPQYRIGGQRRNKSSSPERMFETRRLPGLGERKSGLLWPRPLSRCLCGVLQLERDHPAHQSKSEQRRLEDKQRPRERAGAVRVRRHAGSRRR
jgi:hypothetical protein